MQTSSKLPEIINDMRHFFKSGHKEVGTVYLFTESNKQPNTRSWVRQRNADYIPSSKGKCSPRRSPPPDLRGSPRSRELGGGGAVNRGLPVGPPESRAERAGASTKVVPRQSRGRRQGLAAFPRGTKVGLTPCTASPGSRRLETPAKQPLVPPGQCDRRVGEGTSPAAPPPTRSPGPVD